MKTFVAIIIFLAFSSIIKAQNLTIDQVISLRSKPLASVEEFLTSKSWELNNATEPSEETMGMASFAYNKSYYDDKATSFITYFYSSHSDYKRINIQINKLATYNLYMARLKALNYKLTSSKVINNEIVKIYKGNSLTIQVGTSTQKDDFTTRAVYQFFICTSIDYASQFEEE
jgi:hypothetical protein